MTFTKELGPLMHFTQPRMPQFQQPKIYYVGTTRVGVLMFWIITVQYCLLYALDFYMDYVKYLNFRMHYVW